MRSAFLFYFVFTGLTAFTQVDAGDRILGMHLEASQNADFGAAIAISQQACAASTHLFMPWSRLEATPGNFDGDLVEFLDIADLYYPAFGLSVEINVAPTNTVTREVPTDLETMAWDDPEMINRYNSIVDSVFAHIPNLELKGFMVGNESDVMWSTDEAEVLQFMTFFEAVKSHIEDVYFDLHGTDIHVGTTLTYGGLVNPAMSELYHSLNALADVISVTYYHVGADFTVLPVSDLNPRWDELCTLYDDLEKPIYFVECGSPTSSVLNSSEQHQADFVTAMFESWDEHYDQIKLVYFFMLHDWSQEFVDELAVYYGLPGNVPFTEYLRTLGLRNYAGDGSDKLGMERFRCEADARGFCDAECTIEVKESLEKNWTMYPNPAHETLTIENAVNGTLTMYNAICEEVCRLRIVSGKSYIQLPRVAAGLYVVQFAHASGKIESKPLMIQQN
jgi:hypothetical protein